MSFKPTGKWAGMTAILAASAVLAACASAPVERAAIDARAPGARTTAEHQAIASEYEALAQSEAQASARHQMEAAEAARTAVLLDQGRATRGHPFIMAGQWQLRALAEARAAEDAQALARQHRDMADASDPGMQSKSAR